jgi:hypothetical protein
LDLRIRLKDNFPSATATARTNSPPARLDVRPDTSRTLEHTADVELCEVAISHAFQKMRADFELPIPPLGSTLHVALRMVTRPVCFCLTDRFQLRRNR